jgi:hypothetical protein
LGTTHEDLKRRFEMMIKVITRAFISVVVERPILKACRRMRP